MFGFGERKIKINQLPEEKTETKPQSETEQKLTYTEKETENKDNSHDIKSYKQLDKLLMKLYDISALSVYSYDPATWSSTMPRRTPASSTDCACTRANASFSDITTWSRCACSCSMPRIWPRSRTAACW